MKAEGGNEQHSTVFFTFQFYKFPHITTERLLLAQPDQQLTNDKSAHPYILKRLTPAGGVKEGPSGYQVTIDCVPDQLHSAKQSNVNYYAVMFRLAVGLIDFSYQHFFVLSFVLEEPKSINVSIHNER